MCITLSKNIPLSRLPLTMYSVLRMAQNLSSRCGKTFCDTTAATAQCSILSNKINNVTLSYMSYLELAQQGIKVCYVLFTIPAPKTVKHNQHTNHPKKHFIHVRSVEQLIAKDCCCECMSVPIIRSVIMIINHLVVTSLLLINTRETRCEKSLQCFAARLCVVLPLHHCCATTSS